MTSENFDQTLEALMLEHWLMSHSRKLQTILEAARKRFREGGGIPHEQFWKEVEAMRARAVKKKGRTGEKGRASRKAAKATRVPSAAS